jgi:glycosyltransferase involved in cell wall biosynthesis
MLRRPVTRNAETRATTGASPAVDISVVVPVYNEVRNVAALCDGVSEAMAGFGRSFEILFVDDGSRDGTRAVLRELAERNPQVRVVLFRRNYGQTAAMAAGFEHARGGIVVSMDGDLQNDPADIPRLVQRLESGFDIVCGWRRNRQDRFATRLLPSRIANLLISRVTKVPIHDTGCSLKAYRSWVIRNLTLYSEMHRFIAALAVGGGARVAEVPVRHHPRRHGVSKYGLGRIFRVIGDLLVIKMLVQFAAHPLRWFSLLALPLFVVAPALAVLGMFRFGGDEWTILDRFDIEYMTAAAVASSIAFNVLFLGFLAELQLRASRYFHRRVTSPLAEVVR